MSVNAAKQRAVNQPKRTMIFSEKLSPLRDSIKPDSFKVTLEEFAKSTSFSSVATKTAKVPPTINPVLKPNPCVSDYIAATVPSVGENTTKSRPKKKVKGHRKSSNVKKHHTKVDSPVKKYRKIASVITPQVRTSVSLEKKVKTQADVDLVVRPILVDAVAPPKYVRSACITRRIEDLWLRQEQPTVKRRYESLASSVNSQAESDLDTVEAVVEYSLLDMRKNSETKGQYVTAKAAQGYVDFIFLELSNSLSTDIALGSGEFAWSVSRDKFGSTCRTYAQSVTAESLAAAKALALDKKEKSMRSRSSKVSYSLVDKVASKALIRMEDSVAYNYNTHQFVRPCDIVNVHITPPKAINLDVPKYLLLKNIESVVDKPEGLVPWNEEDRLRGMAALELYAEEKAIENLSGRISNEMLAKVHRISNVSVSSKRKDLLSKKRKVLTAVRAKIRLGKSFNRVVNLNRQSWSSELRNSSVMTQAWPYVADHSEALVDNVGVKSKIKLLKTYSKFVKLVTFKKVARASDTKRDVQNSLARLAMSTPTCQSVRNCSGARRLSEWFARCDAEDNYNLYATKFDPVDAAHYLKKVKEVKGYLRLLGLNILTNQKAFSLVDYHYLPGNSVNHIDIPDIVLQNFSNRSDEFTSTEVHVTPSAASHKKFDGSNQEEMAALSSIQNTKMRDITLDAGVGLPLSIYQGLTRLVPDKKIKDIMGRFTSSSGGIAIPAY